MQRSRFTTILFTLPFYCYIANQAVASGDRPSGQNKSGRTGVINIAFSVDGVHFKPRPEPFLIGGDAPTLAVLPNGNLLAVVDYYTDDSVDAEPVMSVTRSRDGGRTWSRLQPVMLFIPKMVPLRGRHGALVTLADGRVVLYFLQCAEPSESTKGKKRRTAILRAAISRKGLRYRLLNDVNIPVRESSFITGWRHHGAIHLALDSLPASRRRRRSSKKTPEHLISRDGEHFARLRAEKIRGVRFVGSVVPTTTGLRGYFTSTNGIRAFSSERGRKWQSSDIDFAERAQNPAVAKLADEQFVMLTTAPVGQKTDDQDHLVDSSYLDTYQTGHAESMSASDSGNHQFNSASLDKTANTPDTSEVDEAYADDATFLAPVFEDIEFAPLPNWEEKFNYLAWYNGVLLVPTADNAYDEYVKFIPGDSDPEPDFFQSPNMFHTTETVEIGPWDPKRRPEWEKGNRAVQDLLSQFRIATEHDGYAAPVKTGGELVPGDPDSANLLLGIMLPNLSYHRLLTKMSLADAWRKENGKVSAPKMLVALRVGLRQARHMQMGATLIEELVGGAQRSLIYKSALAALKHDVFDDTELIAARDVLRINDPGGKDPMYAIRGEHAFAMDMTQYLFEPDGPNGELRGVPERAKMFGELAMEGSEDRENRIAGMTEPQIHKTLDMFDNYYRELGELMRIGYPSVRAEDIEAVTEDVLHTSPLSEVFLPALSRYYKLNTRIETARRATQLAYEVHVYRSRNGHWPTSLNDLPSEFVEDIRIDPFSGGDFGYRLTTAGPTIYSFSDNGVDDGGVHSRRWGDKITNDVGSDDYVFWPVQPQR